ncbi:MAG: ferritin-like domain-containing protein [Acidobacteriota bacterium]
METCTTTSQPLQIRTSGQWHEHYARNAGARLEIPWELGAELTPEEREAVGPSLQAWQLGETSDGRHLMAAARRYARRQEDPLFENVVQQFIREEQRHGSDLGRFLDLAGIPRIRRDWGDTLFRAVRYCLPSMEIWVTVVIMVETLALLFYKAVRDATGSPVLRRICDQILRDEVHHIRFQYERLAILHRHRSPLLRRATLALHRLLFAGVVLAVWGGHHRALAAGGYAFGSFWRAAWLRMRFAWLRMDPARYAAHSKSGHSGAGNGAPVTADLRAELATDQ